MPWQIGIDEAGYGPNLGPFVMTCVACRVPAQAHEADLWHLLRDGVRRADDDADQRLVVADSKQVYSPARGWCDLEKTVLAAQIGGFGAPAESLLHLVRHFAAADLPHLGREAWFQGDTVLPTEIAADDLSASADGWRECSDQAGVVWGHCRSAIVPAPRFNDLIDRWDSKGAVLGVGLCQLVEQCVASTEPEPMRFTIDKHGGRNAYAALLQRAFGAGMVLAEEEGRLRSVYRVEGLDRPVRVVVTPRADIENFTVALASMISKYLRELLMGEFNRFWQMHVPDLKPTAGYPQDAERYFAAIRPVLAQLGIAERAVWRNR